MIKKSCHDSHTLPLRPWGAGSSDRLSAVSLGAHTRVFCALYALTCNRLTLRVPLCSFTSGGFGGGFNGGGDGGRRGRKTIGDAGRNKPPAAKKPRACGICHTPGHTRVTCPQRWPPSLGEDNKCEAALKVCGASWRWLNVLQLRLKCLFTCEPPPLYPDCASALWSYV